MKITKDMQVKNQLYELCLRHTCFTNHYINKMNLHQGQPRMLMLLWEKDGLTQTEIVETLELRQPTVAKTIERLQKKDILFTKADASDKRLVKVYLTPKGYDLKEEVMRSFEEMAKKMLKGFTSQEKDEFINYMKRIQKNLKESEDI